MKFIAPILLIFLFCSCSAQKFPEEIVLKISKDSLKSVESLLNSDTQEGVLGGLVGSVLSSENLSQKEKSGITQKIIDKEIFKYVIRTTEEDKIVFDILIPQGLPIKKNSPEEPTSLLIGIHAEGSVIYKGREKTKDKNSNQAGMETP